MPAATDAVRSWLFHPLWQVVMGVPAIVCAAAPWLGMGELSLWGHPLSVNHGVLLSSAMMAARGLALHVLPAPRRLAPPPAQTLSPYPPLTPRPVVRVAPPPPPLPDNVLPFDRPRPRAASVAQGAEAPSPAP